MNKYLRRRGRLRAAAGATALFLTFSTGADEGKQPWKLIHKQGIMHFVHLDAEYAADEDQYRFAIAEVCGIANICQVLFWNDAALVPTRLPMTDAQADGKVAHWQRNANTGLRRMLWSCKIVNDPTQCF